MENTSQIATLVMLGVIVVVVFSSIRVAKEHERFAIFILGRFFALKGPGLIIRAPFVHESIRLAIGDKGRFKGDGIAKFQGYGLPIIAETTVGVNTPVTIRSFSNGQVHVESSV